MVQNFALCRISQYMSDNLISDRGKLVMVEAQRTQHQQFSVRFKNIFVKLAGLCSFF
jgi:hypothetical protein